MAELGSDEESEEMVVSAIAAFEEKSFLAGAMDSTRRQFLSRAASIAVAAVMVSIPVPVAAATLSTCSCATVNKPGGSSPMGCCTRVVTPGVDKCYGSPVNCAPVVASIRCGTVACFEPSTGDCSCRTNDGKGCANAGGIVMQRCCVGTDANLSTDECKQGTKS